MNLVGAYLTKLERRLAGRLPRDAVEARVREARSHLEEAARLEGEAAALRRFGPPAATARALVRQARGYGTRRTAALSWRIGLLLAVTLAATGVWLERAFSPAALYASAWGSFLACLLFGARCLKTRRWLAAPVLAWGAVGCALVSASDAAFPRMASASQTSGRSIAWAREAVSAWDRDARDVAAWRTGRPPADAAPYAWRPDATAYVVGVPLGIRSKGAVVYDLARYPGPRPSAAAAWSAHGEGLALAVPTRRRETAAYLAAVEAGLADTPVPPLERARLWAGGVAQLAAALLAYNALALLLGMLVDGG